ncbi:MAG: kynureninase [Burkholderiales bacterium]|nr:kynureninase [Burkholderiales bacterium]MDE1928144.1 kynureninase [Burkholderiales bacterium]MDE2158465.1 kynureninase [Burkholderiales bacterium]MDE2502663.1 kynureninase [Burkholderiales bacterium]
MDRDEALALDAADPLAPLREHFEIPAGLIYLDGNSLGMLPRATSARLREVVEGEWGRGLIGSWNSAGWMELPRRVGDKIASLVGAGPGELVVADSTSVNLYKVLSAALTIAHDAAPQRRVVLSERGNFPTDLYIAEALARERGCELVLAEPGELRRHLDERTAVLMVTQVDYRSGALHAMAALSAQAHAAGALTVWDLAHSAGALAVDLHRDGADFAVGCGYKYLNGGPGAPAFVWAHPRHADRFRQPLAGWMGHAAPFEFTPGYRPAAGIARYLCGTPPVLGLAALECGVDTLLAAQPLGGIAALRAKAMALTTIFEARVSAACPELTLASPRDAARRGNQVSHAHAEAGYGAVQALIARGVVGDFRAPDILRFGFAPIYLRHVDAWDAAGHLVDVMASGAWRRPEFNRRQGVT